MKKLGYIAFVIAALAFIALCGYARYQWDKAMFLHYQRVTSTNAK
jgi:hypothetical protein